MQPIFILTSCDYSNDWVDQGYVHGAYATLAAAKVKALEILMENDATGCRAEWFISEREGNTVILDLSGDTVYNCVFRITHVSLEG